MITQIIIDREVRVEREGLPAPVITTLKKRLIFKNPKYEENQKFERWQGDTPEYLYFIHQDDEYLIMPRGFFDQLKGILDYFNVPYRVKDCTQTLPQVHFDFTGELHDYQLAACKAIHQKNFGILQAGTGSGKTIMALGLIAKRKQPALVIVHSKELLYQWRERASVFLGMMPDEIGLIGDGHKTIGAKSHNWYRELSV